MARKTIKPEHSTGKQIMHKNTSCNYAGGYMVLAFASAFIGLSTAYNKDLPGLVFALIFATICCSLALSTRKEGE